MLIGYSEKHVMNYNFLQLKNVTINFCTNTTQECQTQKEMVITRPQQLSSITTTVPDKTSALPPVSDGMKIR